MKIKRFEASSMSDALRKIKKEFGEEAVILSAKTVKKNSLLGKYKGGQVVVTAAVDRAPATAVHKKLETPDNLPAAEIERAKDRASINSTGIDILKKFNPITLTGQKKVKPKIVELMSAEQETAKGNFLLDLMVSQGISREIAADMEREAADLLPPEQVAVKDYLGCLSQVLEAKELVGPVRRKNRSSQRIVVMLGPSGVGKTTAVAKLCAKHTMQLKESVALISLDNQRVAGTAELERYARIMDVPFKTLFDLNDVKAVMNELAPHDLVIVDTPGLTPEDQILREQLRRLVAVMNNPEFYLLISADAQETVMSRIINFFKPLGIQRLCFTKMDWALNVGPMINRAIASNLPIAYLSDSAKVSDGIQVATGHDLACRILPQHHDLPTGQEDRGVTVVQRQTTASQGNYYVANRNSDIFHLNECKSVQRINTDNMIVFKDPSEAMGRQFKPCRMCCSELIDPKPIDRLARGYAGHRYYQQ